MSRMALSGWRAMPSPVNLSRRGFLSGLGGAGALVLAPQIVQAAEFSAGSALPADARFGAMVSIAADDTITFVCPSSEMGQGTQEALARIIAEELDCDFSHMRVILPWAQEEFNNPVFRRQLTADSRTITGYYASLRNTGAAARAMLVQAASAKLGVPVGELTSSAGTVTHSASARSLSYGELAADASLLPVPENTPLKQVGDFRIIGGATKRLDLLPKVTGEAEFGIDVRGEGMLTATVVLGPHPKAELTATGLDEARSSPGVVAVVPVTGGYAVVATGFWRAKKAADKITLTAVTSAFDGLDDDVVSQRIEASFTEVEPVNFPIMDFTVTPPSITRADKAEVLAAIAGSPRQIEARYEVPYLAHATLEPPCCTAQFGEDGSLFIRGPLQAPGDVRKLMGELHQLPPEKVRVEATYIGGGFGRKWSNDFSVIAVQVAKAVPGRLVKTIYTREQDMKTDEYRPACAVKSVVGLDADGAITGMHSRIAGQSINAYHGRPGMSGLHDMTVAGMLIYAGYDFPNKLIEYHETKSLNVPVGFWRSVSLSQNAFFGESLIDEIAREAGKDPYRMRRELLARDLRLVAVLDKAADMIGWDDTKPAGVGRGIAVSYTANSYSAQAVEVAVEGGALTLRRIVCVADCGLAIDPASAEAQVFGGMIFGLQAALWGQVKFADGKVQSASYADYRMPLLRDMPRVEVAMLQGSDQPGPIGETSTPTIAPALVNAIADAGGPRMRRLPISRELQI